MAESAPTTESLEIPDFLKPFVKQLQPVFQALSGYIDVSKVDWPLFLNHQLSALVVLTEASPNPLDNLVIQYILDYVKKNTGTHSPEDGMRAQDVFSPQSMVSTVPAPMKGKFLDFLKSPVGQLLLEILKKAILPV